MKPDFNPSLLSRLKYKASQSPSTYRLAGVAFSKTGNILGFARNGFRNENLKPGKYSGDHVEQHLIKRYGTKIKTILLIRIGNGGDLLPIDPCEKCQRLMDKMGIEVKTII